MDGRALKGFGVYRVSSPKPRAGPPKPTTHASAQGLGFRV